VRGITRFSARNSTPPTFLGASSRVYKTIRSRDKFAFTTNKTGTTYRGRNSRYPDAENVQNKHFFTPSKLENSQVTKRLRADYYDVALTYEYKAADKNVYPHSLPVFIPLQLQHPLF